VTFAFQHVGPGGLAGWRIIFVALGFVTVVTGGAAAVLLPDSPTSTTFLSTAEKVVLLNHVSENRTGTESRIFRASQLVELLFDVQLWLMTFITALVGRLIDEVYLAFGYF
jgi:hypothetical protein